MRLTAILPWRLLRGSTRRRDSRRRVEGLRCSLGQVLDFSARGLRVACGRKPLLTKGMTVPVLVGSPTRGIGLTATVAWIRQDKANGCWQLGLRVQDAGADLQRTADGQSATRPARVRKRKQVKARPAILAQRAA